MIKIELNGSLVVHALSDGAEHKAMKVVRGLPPGAKLVMSSFHGDILTLYFAEADGESKTKILVPSLKFSTARR